MSKLARSIAVAALAVAALALPSTADAAATNAVVTVTYAKNPTGSGWVVKCSAQTLFVGATTNITSCYATGTGGIPTLCWSVMSQQLTGGTWTSGARCTDPTAAVSDVGGVGVYVV